MKIKNLVEVRQAIEEFDLLDYMDNQDTKFEYWVGNSCIQFIPFPDRKNATITVYMPNAKWREYYQSEVNWCACGSVVYHEAETFAECIIEASRIADDLNGLFGELLVLDHEVEEKA